MSSAFTSKSKVDSLFSTHTNSKAAIENWLHLGGKDYRLVGNRIRLGRALDNEIILDDKSCSRYHAEIEIQNGAIFLQDLKSRNGVKVRGKRISREKLKHQDAIEIGDLRGLFFQKHLHQASSDLPIEETSAGLGQSHGLLDKFKNLEPRRRLMIVGGGFCLLLLLALQILKSPAEEEVSLQAAVAENPCTPGSLVNEPTPFDQFESCREHEDLGNYRLARTCFNRMTNTKEVCEARHRVVTAQEMLSKIRYEEGHRAFQNYYYDLAILKWQEVLLISDDDSTYRKMAKQGIQEAQSKKMNIR